MVLAIDRNTLGFAIVWFVSYCLGYAVCYFARRSSIRKLEVFLDDIDPVYDVLSEACTDAQSLIADYLDTATEPKEIRRLAEVNQQLLVAAKRVQELDERYSPEADHETVKQAT